LPRFQFERRLVLPGLAQIPQSTTARPISSRRRRLVPTYGFRPPAG
jgi:hypothetical protein